MQAMNEALSSSAPARLRAEVAVVRFAGDSGDGIQLIGERFKQATALYGNDLATLPNFPAEIRAPAGTTFGVSSFQMQFGARQVTTPGDAPDLLVALNPAALKVHLKDLRQGGMLVVDTGAFGKRNLAKAGYESDPLADPALEAYRLVPLDIGKQTAQAVSELGLSKSQVQRCRNMWALGLVSWLYDRDLAPSVAWLERRFADAPDLAAANIAALRAGHAFGETAELEPAIPSYEVPRAHAEPGLYRAVTGTEALGWGLVVGAAKAELELFYGSYPITPASNLLHTLSGLRTYGVLTFQAEDEIAAVCAAIGAAFAGQLGVCGSSGPGVALKGEALGLAVATELPLVLVNCQRAGPSTGMPTKTEQSDLFQALYGRNGDAPLPVLAPATPADGFDVAIQAVRIATRYMTPVIVLADGYLVNASEPWRIPDASGIEPFPAHRHADAEGASASHRDAATLARGWPVPGTPGLQHRIGGLERDFETGHISYDPDNHQRMTDVRAAKVANIAADIPHQMVELGDDQGRLAVVGWGSTHGAIHEAVRLLRSEGHEVSHIHLRHLNPFPANLGELLAGFDRVLVPELNNGQLVQLLRARYLVPAEGLSQVTGLPFKVADLEAAFRARLEE